MVSAVRRGALASVMIVVLAAAGAGLGLTLGDIFGTDPAVTPPSREVVWMARALLVLAVAWVLIGMLASRSQLVRRPGAAAARATWLGSTRPWRARESTLGMLRLDHWLLLLVPVALLIATRLLQTSLRAGIHLGVVFGAWAVFALVARWLVGLDRSPFPMIAAVGGVVVLRCIVTLFALSVADGEWPSVFTSPVAGVVYISVAFALFFWVFFAAGGAMRIQIGRRRATGAVLGAMGAALTLPALVVALVGGGRVASQWAAQSGLASESAAEILAFANRFGGVDLLTWVAVALGAALFVVGAAMALVGRPERRAS